MDVVRIAAPARVRPRFFIEVIMLSFLPLDFFRFFLGFRVGVSVGLGSWFSVVSVIWYYFTMKQVFVSRAYEKLSYGPKHFNISVKNLVRADFGSSTGGFVECPLDNGAAKVYSVDAAYGQLAWILRKNAKVVALERTNAIFVKLPKVVDFTSVDTSWTRLEKIIPTLLITLKPVGIALLCSSRGTKLTRAK